ncbi:MAG: hypothetical protein O7C98_13740 [Planctomycetota bacterium]|nr:hypothetical protein [Planctomycetota bacterium]
MLRKLGPLALGAAVLLPGALLRAQDMGMDDEMGGPGISFKHEILPLLREGCFDCHSSAKRKPKSGLRLDGRDWILQGGKGGPVLVAGKPDKSPFFVRLSLPDDHDDVMPPDGSVMEPGDVKLIRRWIEEGADFGDWRGAEGATPRKVVLTPPPQDDGKLPGRLRIYEEMAAGLTPAPGKAIQTARSAGARVEPVLPHSPLWRVEFVVDPVRTTDKQVQALSGLRRHIAVLGLGDTGITDRALVEIAKMQNLVRLDLQKTGVTDKGLRTLAKQKRSSLRRLNLYGTAVTDEGLLALAGLSKLTALYVWDTKATDAGVAALHERLPGCRIQHTRDLPPAEGGRRDGNNRRRRRG